MPYLALWLFWFLAAAAACVVVLAAVGRLSRVVWRIVVAVVGLMVVWVAAAGVPMSYVLGLRERTAMNVPFQPLVWLALALFAFAIVAARIALRSDAARARAWRMWRPLGVLCLAAGAWYLTFVQVDAATRDWLRTLSRRTHAQRLALYEESTPAGRAAAAQVTAAAVSLAEAAETLGSSIRLREGTLFVDGAAATPAHMQECRALLDAMAPHLAALHAAAAAERWDFPPPPPGTQYGELLPEARGILVARLFLCMRATLRAEADAPAEALRDLALVARIADRYLSRLQLMPRQIAASMPVTALDTFRAIGARSTAPLPLHELDLVPARPWRHACAPMLAHERAAMLEVMAQAALHGDFEAVLHETPARPGESIPRLPLYRVFLAADDIALARRFNETIEVALAEPMPAPMEATRAVGAMLRDQEMRLPLTTFVFPAWHQVLRGLLHAEAAHNLLYLAGAIGRFHQESGAWPRDLREMVPSHLPSVPIDPFDEHPMRFERRDAMLVVWSCGPDLDDDGGTADYDRDAADGDMRIVLRIGSSDRSP